MDANRDEYSRKLLQRQEQANSPAANVEGEAGSKEFDFKGAAQKAGIDGAQQSAASGNVMGTVGSGMMMTGNPYLMAAGLGLQVYGAAEANKRAAEEKQRQEYNERIARRQEMMSKIAQMGIQ